MSADARFMAAALAMAERGRGTTAPSPCVGCFIVKNGHVVGRGWSRPGGRPHAEAVALEQAGAAARGATAYVTLEPCAHDSERGPRCAGLLVAAGVARVVAAIGDPDPRTNGRGFAALEAAGLLVKTGVMAEQARRSMAGFLLRQSAGRPHVTLKLALSLDGALAMHDGRSKWITGEAARRHAHLERARVETIVIGRGTLAADAPALDVRLPGLEARSPRRALLSGSDAGLPAGWLHIARPEAVAALPGDHVLVEGGGAAAAAFLRADLVDRLLVYRAPVLIGGGRTIADFGLADLEDAHGRWRLEDARMLGSDRLEAYERVRN